MMTSFSFFLPNWERSWQFQYSSRFLAHFWATVLAAPMVVTVWSSMHEFQALAIRLAANVLLPGTGWVAFLQFMDRVGLMMDLLSREENLARGSLAFFDFHTIKADCDATISFRGRRPTFSSTDFEDTLSLREVFVMVRATNLIDRSVLAELT